MREGLSVSEIDECLRRAAEARHMADAATNPAERADFLQIEQRWLRLTRAHSPQEYHLRAARAGKTRR
jgi:hypothetical protein